MFLHVSKLCFKCIFTTCLYEESCLGWPSLGACMLVYTREKIENNFLTRTELGCISVVAFLYYLQSGLCIIVTLKKSRIRALFRPSL